MLKLRSIGLSDYAVLESGQRIIHIANGIRRCLFISGTFIELRNLIGILDPRSTIQGSPSVTPGLKGLPGPPLGPR